MASRLRHSAHPVEFLSVQVVCTCYFGARVVYALLTLLEIIAVVAAIGVYFLVVKFQYHRAHLVEEKPVVGNHEQGFVATGKEAFQPFYHVEVKMVGWLIQDKHVRVGQQYVCQCHTALLSSAQSAHLLVKVIYLKLCKYLLRTQNLRLISFMIEACIQHSVVGIKLGRLLQIANLKLASEDNIARIVAFAPCQYGEQRRLARAVLSNKTYFLSFGNTERYVLKQDMGSKRFSKILYVKIR